MTGRGEMDANGGRPYNGRTLFAPTGDFVQTPSHLSVAEDRRGEQCSPVKQCSPVNQRSPVHPVRKRNRLSGYDYSQQGAYFITVCTQNRAELFGRIVGANAVRPYTELSDLGQVVKTGVEMLPAVYPMVSVDEFVIMPNHVHMIIVIDDGRTNADSGRSQNGRTLFAPTGSPTVSRIIKQWKGVITKRMGFSPWQKSFHDHVIRSQEDYLHIAEYIENNPAQWEMDSLHPAKTRDTP